MTMKHVTYSARFGYLMMALLGLLSLTGCAQKTITYQLDLVATVQEGRLARQEVDNIAYQVREYVEGHTRATFSRDMETAADRLAYWVNADMVDVCGVIAVKEELPDDDQPAKSAAPEIVSVQVLITYESFAEAADAMQWRAVYADLIYKDEGWEVKSAEEQTDTSAPVTLTINGVDALCLNRLLP
jgi:hypothetical protein